MAKVAYVPETFPQVSETFVINEIAGVLESGYKVVVLPRKEGDWNAKIHKKLQKIIGLIDTIAHDPKKFTAKFFIYALRYSSPIWQGWRPWKLKNHIRCSINVAKHADRIIKSDPDLIVIHFAYDNAIAGVMAALELGIPVILWMHGSDIYTVRHRSLRWIMKHSNEIVTNSRYSQGLLSEVDPYKNIVVSNLGVDLNTFKPGDPVAKYANPTLVCVARLGHNKNHSVLFRIFKKIQNETNENTTLLLVGDGPLRHQYEEEVKTLGLRNVEFLGVQSQEQIIDILQRSWVKVLFSSHEGLGVAAMEAHACGLPCVVSKVGGLPEVVLDNQTGYLVDLSGHDAENIASGHILSLINNKNKCAEMGQLARKRAELLFDEHTHISLMTNLFKKYLNSHIKE